MLVFPGIFKGALEGHSTHITSEMKLAAAHAIAGLVPAEELSDTNILPHAFDPQIAVRSNWQVRCFSVHKAWKF